MTGNSIVADTNIFIDIMKGDASLARKLELLNEVYLSPIVLAELYFGVYRSASPAKHLNKIAIAIAIENCKRLAIDAGTSEIFVGIKLRLFAKGQPIPENDIWIAASAIQHNLPVFTTDRHFVEIDGLNLLQ